MKYKLVFYLLGIIFLNHNCKQSNSLLKEYLKAFIGTDVIIPESLLKFNDINHHIREGVKYKLVFYVDSSSCNQCYLNMAIVTWSNLMNKFENKDFNLYIIFHSQDIEELQTLFKSYNLDIPFFIDLYGDFMNENKLPPTNILHTFLLEDNIVILAGDPSNNSKLLRLYEQEIIKE
jgi:hypothetical protein